MMMMMMMMPSLFSVFLLWDATKRVVHCQRASSPKYDPARVHTDSYCYSYSYYSQQQQHSHNDVLGVELQTAQMSLHVTRALGLHPHGSVPRGTPVDSLGVGRSNHPDLELAIEELHFRVDWA
tara:strand:+ start:39 stop:407 length:369 start_codon:yes stop_codon:yes gene_type:complete